MHSHQNLIRLPDPLGWEAFFHLQSIQTFNSVKQKCMGNFSSIGGSHCPPSMRRSSTILWLLNAPEGIFSHNSIEILKRFYPLYQYIFELCPQHVPDSLHLYSRAPLLLSPCTVPLFSFLDASRVAKRTRLCFQFIPIFFSTI